MSKQQSFTLVDGRFKLENKPKFELTAHVLQQVLINGDKTPQPEDGTNYTEMFRDVTSKGDSMSVQYAYVQDGNDGILKHSIRLQQLGGGRNNPPKLISFNRFSEQEAEFILRYLSGQNVMPVETIPKIQPTEIKTTPVDITPQHQ